MRGEEWEFIAPSLALLPEDALLWRDDLRLLVRVLKGHEPLPWIHFKCA